MKKDLLLKKYYADNDRYADLINGLGFGGKQILHGKDLQDLDSRNIPSQLKDIVSNYKINLIEIRKLQNTGVFRTDIRQVFDFIRCSDDPEELKNLVETDPAYQAMEEDAYDVAAQYTRTEELMKKKEYIKGGKVNMCNAIAELVREGRDAGFNEGRDAGIRVLVRTCRDFHIPQEQIVERLRNEYSLSETEAKSFMEECK